MVFNESLYISLNKIKNDLTAQLAELEKAIELAKPTDDILLNKISNGLMIGIYDFPKHGLLEDQVWFAMQKLVVANIEDIIRYLKMVGLTVNDLNQFRSNIDFVLNGFVDQNRLIVCGEKNEKFRVNKV